MIGRRAQRTLYIQVGAVAAAREAVTRTARKYRTLDRVARELDKFERRGARVIGRGQREVARRRRTVEHEANGLVSRVRRLA